MYRLAHKKPTAARVFSIAAAWLVAGTVSAQTPAASSPLTEREVVERVLARPAFQQLTRALVDAQRGRARAAGAHANPQLNYLREQTYDQLGTGEDYLSIAQTIDLGGRRRTERKAGEARVRHALI